LAGLETEAGEIRVYADDTLGGDHKTLESVRLLTRVTDSSNPGHGTAAQVSYKTLVL
jgi:hypothetical protein